MTLIQSLHPVRGDGFYYNVRGAPESSKSSAASVSAIGRPDATNASDVVSAQESVLYLLRAFNSDCLTMKIAHPRDKGYNSEQAVHTDEPVHFLCSTTQDLRVTSYWKTSACPAGHTILPYVPQVSPSSLGRSCPLQCNKCIAFPANL